MLPARCCCTALWPIRLTVPNGLSNNCGVLGTAILSGQTVTP